MKLEPAINKADALPQQDEKVLNYLNIVFFAVS